MITVRPYKFEWTDDLPKYWFDESPFKTHFMNSLSISFPEGEKYFINSVNHFKDKIVDIEQLSEINKFIAQENWHTYNHKKYNEWLTRQGYDAEDMETFSRAKLQKAKQKLGPLGSLVNTMAIEYGTAISAYWTLSQVKTLDKMHPQFAEFWGWHATEELEHRYVVHNLLCTLLENREFANFAKKKINSFVKITLLVATYDLYSFVISNTIRMLKQDGQLYKWKTLKDAIPFLFNGKNGFFTFMFFPFVRFIITPIFKLKF
jgi:predicted metal-dependent hydrolase